LRYVIIYVCRCRKASVFSYRRYCPCYYPSLHSLTHRAHSSSLPSNSASSHHLSISDERWPPDVSHLHQNCNGTCPVSQVVMVCLQNSKIIMAHIQLTLNKYVWVLFFFIFIRFLDDFSVVDYTWEVIRTSWLATKRPSIHYRKRPSIYSLITGCIVS
jgi:hypothetical protein